MMPGILHHFKNISPRKSSNNYRISHVGYRYTVTWQKFENILNQNNRMNQISDIRVKLTWYF